MDARSRKARRASLVMAIESLQQETAIEEEKSSRFYPSGKPGFTPLTTPRARDDAFTSALPRLQRRKKHRHYSEKDAATNLLTLTFENAILEKNYRRYVVGRAVRRANWASAAFLLALSAFGLLEYFAGYAGAGDAKGDVAIARGAAALVTIVFIAGRRRNAVSSVASLEAILTANYAVHGLMLVITSCIGVMHGSQLYYPFAWWASSFDMIHCAVTQLSGLRFAPSASLALAHPLFVLLAFLPGHRGITGENGEQFLIQLACICVCVAVSYRREAFDRKEFVLTANLHADKTMHDDLMKEMLPKTVQDALLKTPHKTVEQSPSFLRRLSSARSRNTGEGVVEVGNQASSGRALNIDSSVRRMSAYLSRSTASLEVAAQLAKIEGEALPHSDAGVGRRRVAEIGIPLPLLGDIGQSSSVGMRRHSDRMPIGANIQPLSIKHLSARGSDTEAERCAVTSASQPRQGPKSIRFGKRKSVLGRMSVVMEGLIQSPEEAVRSSDVVGTSMNECPPVSQPRSHTLSLLEQSEAQLQSQRSASLRSSRSGTGATAAEMVGSRSRPERSSQELVPEVVSIPLVTERYVEGKPPLLSCDETVVMASGENTRGTSDVLADGSNFWVDNSSSTLEMDAPPALDVKIRSHIAANRPSLTLADVRGLQSVHGSMSAMNTVLALPPADEGAHAFVAKVGMQHPELSGKDSPIIGRIKGIPPLRLVSGLSGGDAKSSSHGSDLPRLTSSLSSRWTHAAKNPHAVRLQAKVDTLLGKSGNVGGLVGLRQRLSSISGQLSFASNEKSSRTHETSTLEKGAFSFRSDDSADVNSSRGGEQWDPIAWLYPAATVMFVYISNMATLSVKVPPRDLIAFLNDLYSQFDTVVSHNGAYKVMAIANMYLVVTGAPDEDVRHASMLARAALGIMKLVKRDRVNMRVAGVHAEFQIGLHSGEVAAGVIGQATLNWHIFGDTVNTASRMCSNSETGKIQVSPVTVELLVREASGRADLSLAIPTIATLGHSECGKVIKLVGIGGMVLLCRGATLFKGKGSICSWWLSDPELDAFTEAEIISMAQEKAARRTMRLAAKAGATLSARGNDLSTLRQAAGMSGNSHMVHSKAVLTRSQVNAGFSHRIGSFSGRIPESIRVDNGLVAGQHDVHKRGSILWSSSQDKVVDVLCPAPVMAVLAGSSPVGSRRSSLSLQAVTQGLARLRRSVDNIDPYVAREVRNGLPPIAPSRESSRQLDIDKTDNSATAGHPASGIASQGRGMHLKIRKPWDASSNANEDASEAQRHALLLDPLVIVGCQDTDAMPGDLASDSRLELPDHAENPLVADSVSPLSSSALVGTSYSEDPMHPLLLTFLDAGLEAAYAAESRRKDPRHLFVAFSVSLVIAMLAFGKTFVMDARTYGMSSNYVRGASVSRAILCLLCFFTLLMLRREAPNLVPQLSTISTVVPFLGVPSYEGYSFLLCLAFTLCLNFDLLASKWLSSQYEAEEKRQGTLANLNFVLLLCFSFLNLRAFHLAILNVVALCIYTTLLVMSGYASPLHCGTHWLQAAAGLAISIYVAYERERARRSQYSVQQKAREHKERCNRVLLNMLPSAQHVERLMSGEHVVEELDDVTLLYSDIRGFTQMSSAMSAESVIDFLDALYLSFDQWLPQFGVYKIETIGDAFIVVGGLQEAGKWAIKNANIPLQRAQSFSSRVNRIGPDDRGPLTAPQILQRIGASMHNHWTGKGSAAQVVPEIVQGGGKDENTSVLSQPVPSHVVSSLHDVNVEPASQAGMTAIAILTNRSNESSLDSGRSSLISISAHRDSSVSAQLTGSRGEGGSRRPSELNGAVISMPTIRSARQLPATPRTLRLLPTPALEDRTPVSHVGRVALFSIMMLDLVRELQKQVNMELEIRVGIHTGRAIGGIIGRTRPRFFVWGEDCDIANRMESSGVAMQVQVSEVAALRLALEGFLLVPYQKVDVRDDGHGNSCDAEGDSDEDEDGLASARTGGKDAGFEALPAVSPRSLVMQTYLLVGCDRVVFEGAEYSVNMEETNV